MGFQYRHLMIGFTLKLCCLFAHASQTNARRMGSHEGLKAASRVADDDEIIEALTSIEAGSVFDTSFHDCTHVCSIRPLPVRSKNIVTS
ncbi:hypothetical protein ASD52_29845 [Ensifer sp. Root142]|nr:hypothetical protein ASD52_29845 [Ensifer sp. Root142]